MGCPALEIAAIRLAAIAPALVPATRRTSTRPRPMPAPRPPADSLHPAAFERQVSAELPAVPRIQRIDISVGLAQVVSGGRELLLDPGLRAYPRTLPGSIRTSGEDDEPDCLGCSPAPPGQDYSLSGGSPQACASGTALEIRESSFVSDSRRRGEKYRRPSSDRPASVANLYHKVSISKLEVERDSSSYAS